MVKSKFSASFVVFWWIFLIHLVNGAEFLDATSVAPYSNVSIVVITKVRF